MKVAFVKNCKQIGFAGCLLLFCPVSCFPTSSLTIQKLNKTHRSVILRVVLYGCETCSLALNEEHRLRLFENRVVRRMFGPRKEEVAGGWRRLHNEELHNLYAS
jgi:hypothetical protein